MNVNKNVPYVELPAFQGPLDLLLHLIQQEKVDIYDIPVAKIADQFIEAVRQMETVDMEVTSEFLVLAAQLLYIKSRLLLPKPPQEVTEAANEDDPRQELVERLLAYKAYKNAAEVFGQIQVFSGQRYFRKVDLEELRSSFPKEDPLQGVSFENLWQAFFRVVERAQKGEEIQNLEPDQVSIELMLKDVLRRVILNPDGIRFSYLIRGNSRMEIVVSFLAILELLKVGKIRCEQSAPQHDIHVFPTPQAWEFEEGD